MKRTFIVILVLSLSLVGSFSNSYADVGDFITSIDDISGGKEFSAPAAVAVDSTNRIIVSDVGHNLVQIYDSEGSFLTGFNGTDGGGTEFSSPIAIAVDSNNYRIIVVDNIGKLVQIFDSDGTFVADFDGTDNGGTKFDNPRAVAVDSNNRIIVSDDGSDIVQIYDSTGSFLTSFDGTTGGGIEFVTPLGVAVDSNNRIIVSDVRLDTVQIFDSQGVFITGFNGTDGGGTEFSSPFAVAVDSDDRIIVSDAGNKLVQIYDSEGSFLTEFDGSDGDGIQFIYQTAVAVDSNNRIIVVDIPNITVQIYEGFNYNPNPDDGDVPPVLGDPGDGGCGDCTPPTLGLDLNFDRIVDNGFSYNDNSVQVEEWHTPFPLITAQVGQLNTVEIIVYENSGIHNMKLVQFGLGATELGQPLNDLEVLIEVWLETFGTDDEIGIEKVIIKDRDNLIDTYTVFAVADVVKCSPDAQDEKCVKVTLQYSYREATINNVMLVNVMDNPRNSQNFYFNDGVQVVGESLNEPPTYVMSNKHSSQQIENLTLTLTRTDKVNNIWKVWY